jgi:hypothetical protein
MQRATFAHSLFGESLESGVGVRGTARSHRAKGHRVPGRFFGGRRPGIVLRKDKRQALEPLKSVVQRLSFQFLFHICDTNTNKPDFVSIDLTFADVKSVERFLYLWIRRANRQGIQKLRTKNCAWNSRNGMDSEFLNLQPLYLRAKRWLFRPAYVTSTMARQARTKDRERSLLIPNAKELLRRAG